MKEDKREGKARKKKGEREGGVGGERREKRGEWKVAKDGDDVSESNGKGSTYMTWVEYR